MKSLSKGMLITLCAVVFSGTAYFGFNTSKAQESDSLLQKMDQLVSNLDALVKAISPEKDSDEPEIDENGDLVETENSLQSVYHLDLPYARCIDGYTSWPSSAKMKENAPWSLQHIYDDNYQNPDQSYLDLNGDGLTDYLYVSKRKLNYTTIKNGRYNHYNFYINSRECVLLNNGSGFDLAYRCVVAISPYVRGQTRYPMYYGDCADLD